ncbi:YcaO-like family protein [Alkalimonas collagenimarina]|uniref:YcaO-like family protein n=1 Tax=Alkalimonas collagenimarina TaxID=400390 RepID=A0ABT9GVN9_9GAMM|nr:YcaO-like family protein [Alkalimonas collagenimarina]MDP4535125.1 YcaO-like family protein [Alkalimonas collagenimarina]
MDQLNETLSRLVAPNFGLLTYVSEVQIQAAEPDIFVAVAEYQDPIRVSEHTRHMPLGSNDDRQASGAGLDREAALWSTLGEAVERYASSIVDTDNLYYASFDELDGGKLNPRDMILFADWQYDSENFPYARFCENKPYGWVKGYNLSRGEEAHIPARFVYLNYMARYPHEALDNGYSTGLAAGPTMAAALCSGIREILERDAFSCHFLNRISAPKIDLAVIWDDLPGKLQRVLSQSNIDYSISNITSEFGYPVVMSILKSGDKLGFSTGTSCHSKAGLALQKAVVESFHTFNWVLDMNRWQEPLDAPEKVRSFADHVAYYLDPARHQDLQFMTDQKPAVPFHVCLEDFQSSGFADKAELQRMLDVLKAHGYEVFAVDLTTDDIASLGFTVVKVVIPGLQPLYCGHGNQHLDPRRLRQFTEKMGYQAPEQFNTTLHAFP